MYFNTDKILPHQYFQSYARIAGILGPEARVCELGVLEGESLRMWQALFPLGEVYGVDSSEISVWPQGTVRIVASHDDPMLPGMLPEQLDLIIDDGCHVGSVVRKSFDLLWEKISPGGFYVIEDWMISLRKGERPGETWGYSGNSMLRVAESFLSLLKYPDSECESIEYRYGLIILHKRGSE